MEKQRLLYVDNLRILLITMVIGVHLSITYGGGGSWSYKEVLQPDIPTFLRPDLTQLRCSVLLDGPVFLRLGIFHRRFL